VERLHDQHDLLTLVDALRMQAAVAIRHERWDEAAAALDEALALARQMPYPYAEAKLLATYGDLMVASGQPTRAQEQYTAALAILQPLGEVPYTERIQQALDEMRCH
jgi:tetratricopeptide (TPR) repeat protein